MTITQRTGTLEPLVRPNSVAVIGASTDLMSYPGQVMHNLQKYRYQGRVYPVNPKYQEVAGFRCYPNIADVDEPVDCALILLAARRVPAALEGAVKAGCRSAIVFAAGMAETGEEGAAAQREIRRLAREAGIRVLGPNGLGFVNAADGIVLSGAAAMQRGELIPGRIGLAAQSGGMMGSIIDRARLERTGFSYTFSTGNEADLTIADCLEFMVEDPKTQVIALFAEAIRDVPKFRAACERAAEVGKAVVILKVGKSVRGRQVALTHTAALTGNDAALDALFERLGVIRATDVDELFSIPGMLVKAPLPRGQNLAFAAMSGGLCSLTADKCADYGIRLPDIMPETAAQIRELQKGFGTAYNPLDIVGHVVSTETWWMFRRMLELMLADPNVDMLVVGQPTSQYSEHAAEDIITLAQGPKPVASLWTARDAIAPALARVREAQVPFFDEPDLCFRTVRGVFRLVGFREKRDRALAAEPFQADEARRAAALAILAAAPDGLSEHESKQLLSLYGLPVAEEAVVQSAAEAAEAAQRLGFPVAVKAHGRSLRHKSDLGAVRLDVADALGAAAAFAAVTQAAGTTEALVSRMMPAGQELILGLTRDPQVGLLLLVGTGGIFVEVLKDVALAVPPLWPGEAAELLARLRGSALLDGVRGRPAADRAAAVAAIEALSTLAAEIGDAVEQLDVNPLIVGPGGARVVDALVIPRTKE